MRCPSCQSENTPDSRFCSRCATPLPLESTPPSEFTKTLISSIDTLQRGAFFAGRYEIIEEVGKGGMGRVYKAFDRQVKEVVALKLLKPEISFNEKAVERFRNELKFARKIAHPRVCRLYDLGESGLTHYLTMEFVEGEDLKAFIRRSGHITTPKAVDLALQIAEGLAEAHRLGVVHRDLKPQNVMIDREGKAKIMDFGLARFAESDGVTGSGLMLGTPEYMAPEQVDLKEVDARADLYALGIILYEMVTGHAPFKGATPLAVAIKQKSEKARDARESNPLIPESLVGVIARLLEKDRDRRYADAAGLIADLEAIAGDTLSTARGFSRAAVRGSGSTAVKRRRRALTIAAPLALVVVAVAGSLIFIKKGTEPTAEPGKVVLQGRDETQDAGRMISRYLNSKDPQSIGDIQKALGAIKPYLPEKGPYLEAFNQAQKKLIVNRPVDGPDKPGPPGKDGASEVRGEMQQLMDLISERQSAQKARDDMAAAKSLILKRVNPQRNFLFRVAVFEEGNAGEAFAKNDYAGARSLYRLLERLYDASPQGESERTGLDALKALLTRLKIETQALSPDRIDPWLSSYAQEIEVQADGFAEKGEVENACGAYVRAAFLHEKIKDAAA